MQSFARHLLLLLFALLPGVFAAQQNGGDRSTVYVTSTIKKVTTHYVTASVYLPSTTEVYTSASVETYSPVYSTYYKPTGATGTGGPSQPTTPPTYSAPSQPSATASPTGAAGQIGANVLMVAGAVAGVGAMML